jgi:GrpB-like predicted nucleotidyltransferase (UPF0157 family)
MVRHIRVVPHDPHWAALYQEEAARLAALLADEFVASYHIGSTAIPGISAKPIIDILVEVRDIGRVDALDSRFMAMGYLPKGENGLPGRRLFIKGSEEERSHHVHIYQAGNPAVRRHLAFRDYMIAHPAAAQAYSRLKEELARRFPQDAGGYVAGKDEFVREMERRALAWWEEAR